ncbi:MAG: linear amide C-N hydrolase [Duncaniella sp.]|nr:linear amide C-N hydrolase [Duncaniella sp.]MDE7145309.1 linear amide C-N hydrolase [Duncaniella sp.]
MKTKLAAILLAAAAIGSVETSEACSRVLYQGNDSLLIVGRSLDWKTPIPTNIYVYPRGMKKEGSNLPDAVKWTSKYGAVYAVGYDGGVTEGMNEKGLAVNSLFCKGTVYDNDSTKSRPPMSLAMFPAWILDLCATTREAVDLVAKHDFNISGATFDNGTVSTLHWGITDEQGHSAIIEFDHGNINVYEGDDITVLTNDPTFPQINAINDYWVKKGGTHTLPGTVSSPDRFVRAYFFDHSVKKTGDADLGLAIIRSILYNVSVPYTYEVESEGNLSSTQWRSFSNLRDKRYYFDLVTNPGIFYIDLNKCDFRPGASVMKIDTSKSSDYVGDATGHLFKVKPFTPMY